MQFKSLNYSKVLIWVIILSIAMAYLESAVVVYLRAMYYPFGFGFPLPIIQPTLAITEIGREFATLIMLIAIGVLAGKNTVQRFGYFLLSFAIWDIFYYIFLRMLIHWPVSVFEWDILFLIPVVWASPVIYPVIVSISMFILGILLIIGEEKKVKKLLTWQVWTLLIIGSLFILASFTMDNISYLFQKFGFKDLISIYGKSSRLLACADYSPGPFNWEQFFLGEILVIIGIIIVFYYFRKSQLERSK